MIQRGETFPSASVVPLRVVLDESDEESLPDSTALGAELTALGARLTALGARLTALGAEFTAPRDESTAPPPPSEPCAYA